MTEQHINAERATGKFAAWTDYNAIGACENAYPVNSHKWHGYNEGVNEVSKKQVEDLKRGH